MNTGRCIERNRAIPGPSGLTRARNGPLTAASCVALLLIATVCHSADDLNFPSTQPTESKVAAKAFHVLDGFEMQLIAAEPLVTDPVAITYDEDGRAFVCEMNDYPYTDKEQHKHAQENPTDAAIGRVRQLIDTDGDGIFDKSTVFAENLSWPTGCACWKGGIFVCATPDIWYLKDTDGDGIADIRVKVFTGFKKLNVQAVMNNPIWGLDHRIYIAGGSNGGEIRRVPGSESVMPLPADFKPLPIKRNDFSFDPSTGDTRLESGGARFGNTFDDWGNRFLCNIRNPCQHVVLPHRYLARNPFLVVPSALNDCAEAGDQLPVYRTSPTEPWRDFRAMRWVNEGSTLPKSELVGAGVVTSSSGITVYRGDAYPPEYRDFAFVADVAGNLFYRMKLVPAGVTFKAVQVDGQKNFCTSDDVWFRPVNFVNAPDGCLHVCDMYREVIEHPWSIPDDIHASLDLLRGRDRGRIWRLEPKVVQSDRSDQRRDGLKPRTTLLGRASAQELVALLDHPNAWHRETAQRLLFERQDKAVGEPLRAMVKEGKTAQGRVSALWALAGSVGQTDAPSSASKPGLRQTHRDVALLVATEALEDAALVVGSQAAAVIDVMRGKNFSSATAIAAHGLLNSLLLTERRNPAALNLAWCLGSLNPSRDSASALMKLATSNPDDPWLRSAVLASVPPGEISFCIFSVASSHPERAGMHSPALVEALAQQATKTADKTLLAQLCTFAADWDRELNGDYPIVTAQALKSLVNGIVRGAYQKGLKLSDIGMSEPAYAWWHNRLQAELTALDTDTTGTSSALQFATVSLLPLDKTASPFARFLGPTQTSELQLAAIEAFGSYREPEVADILIDAWKSLTPPLRDKAITIILSRTDRIAKLLDAIEARRIMSAQLSTAAKATLARQKTPALAERIAKLINTSSSNRAEVITTYQTTLSLKGDVARGALIYQAACMVCHKHGNRGNDVGPHLGTIKSWTPEQILTNILDPNREVSPNFALYVVETNDGRTLAGLIASEVAGNLTLKLADGSQQSVLRSEIKTLSSPGISLMPEGLEAAITPQQMADLIAALLE